MLLTNRQMIFERKTEGERVLVALNIDGEPYTAHFDAGCGLAWCTVPADRADMETFLKECSIECEDMAELLY